MLGPILFLIYINDLWEGLSSNAELFADDTSLFSVIYDSNTSALELNSGLAGINRWAFQWKMSFNPDPKNKRRKLFSVGNLRRYRIPLVFNNGGVVQAPSQGHLPSKHSS